MAGLAVQQCNQWLVLAAMLWYLISLERQLCMAEAVGARALTQRRRWQAQGVGRICKVFGLLLVVLAPWGLPQLEMGW